MTSLVGSRDGLVPPPAWHDVPVFLPAGPEQLFGVLTSGSTRWTPTSHVGVLLLQGGSISLGHNRLWPRTAQALAGMNISSLRLDIHGGGDSTGVGDDRLATGQCIVDVRSGVSALRRAGAERILVAGRCWAGLVGLLAAAEIPAVTAAALIASPLDSLLPTPAGETSDTKRTSSGFRVLRSLARADAMTLLLDSRYRRWLGNRALRRIRARPAPVQSGGRLSALTELHTRGVAVHTLFGTDDTARAAFHARTTDPVRHALRECLHVREVFGDVHLLRTIEAQRHVSQFVCDVAESLA